MNFKISAELIEQFDDLSNKVFWLSLEKDVPGYPKNYFLTLSQHLQGISNFLYDPEDYIQDLRNFIESTNIKFVEVVEKSETP